jgi:opacity protein-like surface antigen
MTARVFLPGLALVLIAAPSPAYADATIFVGPTTEPEVRRTIGAALGVSLLIVGFEFEYASTSQDVDGAVIAPEVRSFMGNAMLQTPFPLGGVQLYGTAGFGVVRVGFDEEFARQQRLEASDTRFGTNIGGGAKIVLAGPLRLRLDYRLLFVEGTFIPENPQRFYAGLNLAF